MKTSKKNIIKLNNILLSQLILGLLIIFVSCNAKSEDDESEIVVTPAIVAVKSFSLEKNDKVLSNLDSVYFAIDLNTGVIFNSDSLPVGTDVSKLVATITFANTMTKAELSYVNNDSEKVVVDYLTNPTDTIDFRYPVNLDVTAQNGTTNYSYQIKVNVHKTQPDTLTWAKLSTSLLPSRTENPVAQKTVYHQNKAYCLVEENNGEYTLSTCEDLNVGQWEKNPLVLGFTLNIESFSSTSEFLWLLNEGGELYKSNDGLTWETTEEKWLTILGAYGETLFGLKEDGNEILHTVYPRSKDFIEIPIEMGFPIKGSTTLQTIETEWADSPFAFLACGITDTGEVSSAVWAFDGSQWGIINDDYLPAMTNAELVRYVVYRDTPIAFKQRRFDVWMLMGGENEDGEYNRTIYISYNNGVTWQEASSEMQLPETFPSLSGSNLIVASYDLTTDVSEAWTPVESSHVTRSGYVIKGFDMTWYCPYLYVFGGYSPDGILNKEIWRGVLARLTFMPEI